MGACWLTSPGLAPPQMAGFLFVDWTGLWSGTSGIMQSLQLAKLRSAAKRNVRRRKKPQVRNQAVTRGVS